MDYRLLVDSTILAGEIMLKNGAVTYIVEDNMDKLLNTAQMKHVEAVVMTTSITVTLSDPKLEHITAVSRIHERTTNLNRVYEVTKLIDKYCADKISLKELFHSLKELKRFNQYNDILKSIALIIIPPAFTIMLNGSWLDAIVAIICGLALVLLNIMFKYIKTNDFIKTTFIMFITTFISCLFNKILNSNIESVIIGVIMPFVPGIAITNAARDAFSADYMSASARLLDAIIQALSVAIGVFVGIFISNLILGGM